MSQMARVLLSLAFLLCNVLTVLGMDTSDFVGLSIQKDNALVQLGKKGDVKLYRVGKNKAAFEGDLDFQGKLSVKDLTLNGQDLVHLLKTMQAKINALTAKLQPPCVTNGIGGGKTKTGEKIPKGTPCTGWYQGKQHKEICEGVAYGGRGWCGVEAAPGKTGKYTSKDGAWGGCVKECPRGLARCECPNGKPLTGPACNQHGEAGCESCKALYKLSDDKKSCEAVCVTNGIGGGKTKTGEKVPKGTPCTGWYQGKQHKEVCEGTAYGGKGWCGVEAPPGKSGKYSAKDAAWGGCVKACPKGGVAQCTCPNGTPLKGPECNEHGTPGCKSCGKLYALNSAKTACKVSCVTNGIGGGKTRTGEKVPKGTPCTGWYNGKQHKDFCTGTGYGGRGWCGVEAPPGKSGKYSGKDAAWGGCVKACPKGL